MYVCICNAVTESAVRRCVREGACSLSDLRMQLGIACQCGACASTATEIIHEETALAADDRFASAGLPRAAPNSPSLRP